MIKNCPKCNEEHKLISWGNGFVIICGCGTIQFYNYDGTLNGNSIFANAAKKTV